MFPFSFWITLLLIVVAMGAIQGTCAYLILLERKISAWAQDRIGPNRVGRPILPWGLAQPIADGLKFLFKEQVIPRNVDRLFYLLAPGIAILTATLAFAVVPFGPTSPAPVLIDYRDASQHHPIWLRTVQEQQEVLDADAKYAATHPGTVPYEERVRRYNENVQFVIAPRIDFGMIWVFAIGSLAVYAVILGGWSSNNKYSFLGSLRSSAQLISYEIPMGLSVLGVFLITGSLNLERIIAYQAENGWNILFQPLAALLFATSIFAECNRLPFDLSEAEQELVGGYHTEYSGMKFAMFFLGEYTHMITTSFLMVILFFGGWHFPWIAPAGDQWSWGMAILKLLVIAIKMALFICFFMIVRWTLPRFRFDQLMGLTWKVLMPLGVVALLAVLVVRQLQWSPWVLLPLSILILIGAAALAVLMPRGPTRPLVVIRGHPVANPVVFQDGPAG
jgi:NADH-quinone oxidoreductase subunit H